MPNVTPIRDPALAGSSSKRATYGRGKARVADILEAARELFIEEGMTAFTMRRLARELGISLGNLTYYYPNKNALLGDLMAYVVAPYLERFADFGRGAGGDPEAHLRAVLDYVIQDLNSFETTRFFPELWSMANRDDASKAHMESLYSAYRLVLEDLINRMRPDLAVESQQDLALMIQCSIEGHTMFVGHQRSHEHRLQSIKPRLLESCIRLVKEADNST